MILKAFGLKYWLGIILLSLIGSIFFLNLMGNITFNFEALEFKLGIQVFSRGCTDINIPPIGTVRAKTHLLPIRISFTLQNIDLKLLETLLETAPEKEQLFEDFKREISNILDIYFLKLFVISALGGMLGSILFERNQIKPLLYSALVGVLFCTLILVGTVATYDISTFQNPEYQGALEAAPWMMGLAEQAFVQLNTLGEQLQIMAQNIYLLFEKINTMESLSTAEGTIKILHVSDLHNNQAALKFINQVINSFNVDLVIDSGDLTDYGTPIEAQILDYLADFPVPYLFVAGNHDSTAIINKLEQFSQVKVLNEGVLEIAGLKIIGLADPASLTNDIVPAEKEMVEVYQNKLKELWENNRALSPQIAVIHNYKIGQVLAGKVPLILHGHDHGCKIYNDQGTLVIDAGTSGAAGIRGLQATKEIPYTVVLLHFQKEEENLKITAIDTITFHLTSGFTLDRQVIDLPIEFFQ